jgi:hypothetical protein
LKLSGIIWNYSWKWNSNDLHHKIYLRQWESRWAAERRKVNDFWIVSLKIGVVMVRIYWATLDGLERSGIYSSIRHKVTFWM